MKPPKQQSPALSGAHQQLLKLIPLANQLNQATDAYTEELRAIEEQLVFMRMGLEVTLGPPLEPLDSSYILDEDPPTFERTYLGFGRYGQGWKLLARTFLEHHIPVDEGPEDLQRTFVREAPVLELSRHLRVKAADHIETLLQRIAKEAERRLVTLQGNPEVREPLSINALRARKARERNESERKECT